ncbi:hypothetical protein ACWEVD_05735 [Nocardia thailandica]|uniref:DUF2613 domain-containing protein n=1 Tax=Nocardia thailandica TaxID=257275 RepID=A0ABW6PN85_9NOCA|nr:hypothetical protein [Nocardia thailandica]
MELLAFLVRGAALLAAVGVGMLTYNTCNGQIRAPRAAFTAEDESCPLAAPALAVRAAVDVAG